MKSKKHKKTHKKAPKAIKKERKNVLAKVLLVLMILGSLGHIYYSAFGFAAPQVETPGITGHTITADAVLNWEALSLTSRFIIAGEWLAVLAIILYLLIKGRLTLEKDLETEKGFSKTAKAIQSRKSAYETDLDVLHNILKEKKILRLSAIAKTFGINIKTATEWVQILEEGDLATLSYPTVGSPKVTINTYLEEIERKKEEKRNKKKNLKEDGEK